MKKRALPFVIAIYVLGSLTACFWSETKSIKVEAGAIGEVLIMATEANFPPYEYYEDGKLVGIDIDVAYAIAEKLGMTLQIEDMAFDSIIPEIRADKVDIGVAAITINAERLKKVDFANSYATATQIIIVKEDSEITTPDDLKGKRIGVQLGTTGDSYASKYETDGAVIKRYGKGSEAVEDLIQGEIHAVVIDKEVGKVFVAEHEGIKLLENTLTVEYYAIAVKKDNTELIEKINTALEELEESGELQRIMDRYIFAN